MAKGKKENAAAAGSEVPQGENSVDTAAAGPTEKAKKAPAGPRTDIIRGRMPVIIVYMVKHGDNRNESIAAKAKLFGTTTGKIDDIVKERGFKYVTADFAPTSQQKTDGVEYLKKHVDYDKGGVDKLLNELESYTEATEEQAKAFETVRAAAHGQPFRKKDGSAVVDAGGGNRKGKAAEETGAGVSEADLTQ
jgi:hypothetical protein